MNWLKKAPSEFGRFALVALVLLGSVRCGVKGDPLPPERPPDLGRGRPTYKRAIKDVKLDKDRAPETDPDDANEEEDER